MKEETFAKLVTSIKEAGEIKAGHRTPSRTYEITPPKSAWFGSTWTCRKATLP